MGALLSPPAAPWAEPASRQPVDRGREQADNPVSELAPPTVEVDACAFCAWCRDPEHLPRIDGTGRAQQLLGELLRLLKIRDDRFFSGAADNAKQERAVRLRRCAGAEQLPSSTPRSHAQSAPAARDAAIGPPIRAGS